MVCLPNDNDIFDMHLHLYDVCELQYIRKKSTYEHYVLARIRETRGDRERMFVREISVFLQLEIHRVYLITYTQKQTNLPPHKEHRVH